MNQVVSSPMMPIFDKTNTIVEAMNKSITKKDDVIFDYEQDSEDDGVGDDDNIN